MTTFTTRTVSSRRREWVIPAAEPWGAAAAEIGKAWTAAQVAYRELHGLPVDASLPDNALQFRPRDDEIVISFTTEVSG